VARASILALVLAMLSSGYAPPAGRDAAARSAPPGDTILARARAVFRARACPPFVVYTISRTEHVGMLPDFENTYVNRIWYRGSDGAALTRRMHGGTAHGPLIFERPRFNAALDPGPPTADIFEPAPARLSADAGPEPTPSALQTIGSVSTSVESDYRAEVVDADARTYHLRLTPRRDPDRNRLRELWIDRESYAVRRFVATDRMYHGDSGSWDPETFDARLDREDDVPVIRSIISRPDLRQQPWTYPNDEEGDYRFSDISFPQLLPDWYFHPETYGAHAQDAPLR
jgi:hypothetical protein